MARALVPIPMPAWPNTSRAMTHNLCHPSLCVESFIANWLDAAHALLQPAPGTAMLRMYT